jgi:hypothetical protein
VVNDGQGHPYEYLAFWEKWEYRLWVCRGCDTGTLEEAYTNMAMEREDGQAWESTYYPRQDRGRALRRFRLLDNKLSEMYRETIESYNAGLDVLCAAGLRALLEGICASKGISAGNKKEMIDRLADDPHHLPPNIVESLHGFRFIGNKAIHELEPPTEPELALAMDVMEDLLNFMYELEYKARCLLKHKPD